MREEFSLAPQSARLQSPRSEQAKQVGLLISKFLPLFILVTIAAPAVCAAQVMGAAAGSANQPQALGSVKDYVGGDSDSAGENED
jgi:hypothetical protein